MAERSGLSRVARSTVRRRGFPLCAWTQSRHGCHKRGEGLEGQSSSGFHVDTAILRFSSTLCSWSTICCARKRRRRRRTRRGKETGDTRAAVNFVYVLAGTDFFEGFSVYTSPFLSLIPTVFVSDLVWGWFLCGRAVSNGSVRLKSFSHSAASCSRL